jgi:hypothetical protein
MLQMSFKMGFVHGWLIAFSLLHATNRSFAQSGPKTVTVDNWKDLLIATYPGLDPESVKHIQLVKHLDLRGATKSSTVVNANVKSIQVCAGQKQSRLRHIRGCDACVCTRQGSSGSWEGWGVWESCGM